MRDLTAKLASTSRVEMTELVMPSDANVLGTAFGGRVMQWTDLAASMAAMRHARMPVVTASIDELAFLSPIRVGEIAVLRAQVNAVFGSSMEVEVAVSAESPAAGEKRPCCRAFLTFVALGPDGKPAKAPLLLTETGEEERRAREAERRREERLARRRRDTPLP
ncbi:MAG TPA: acyl-CoA thioesterase [Anaeromyxobacteraceae bacterium]|nr:acyl-CoA thioesterase [Anaeromyxobacteraceae bacterium]